MAGESARTRADGETLIVYLQMLHSAPEQDKFRALYEAYSGLMYHVADRLLPDDAEAEDAVHQALVAIIENLDKIARPVGPQDPRPGVPHHRAQGPGHSPQPFAPV